MLNYYLGKRAADEGRDSRYPNIDFCKDPGAVCTREEHPELKWIGEYFVGRCMFAFHALIVDIPLKIGC